MYQNQPHMIEIKEGNITKISVKNFTGTLRANYNYITEPLYLVDVGYFDWAVNPIDFEIELKFFQKNEAIGANVTSLNLARSDDEIKGEKDPGLKLDFMGVSDFSDYVTRGANFIGNTLFNRAISLAQ